MTGILRRNRKILITLIVVLHILLQIHLSGLSFYSGVPINELLDLVVVVLLALIWRGSWVKFAADPTAQKRDVFAAFTVVNLRQYLDLFLLPSVVEILADFLSLTTVYLMLRSQAKTIFLSYTKQRWVRRFYIICSALILVLGIALELMPAVTLQYLYMFVFTGSHLVIVALVLFWYFIASLTSSDLLVGWRFRFLVLAAVAYFAMFLFNMFATLLGRYDLPGWDVTFLSIKTGLIAIGLYSIYLAFSMSSSFAELLLKISARRRSSEIWDDLILLAARLSDVVAARPGNIVSVYAASIAKELGLSESQQEVLRSAANTAYLLWYDELPELSMNGVPKLGAKESPANQLASPVTLFAEQLFHLQAVSKVLRAVDRPYGTRRSHVPIESRILRVVLDYLRFGSLDMLQVEKGKTYDPRIVDSLTRLVDMMENTVV